MEHLTEDAAYRLVEEYMARERPARSTQDILNSNAVPRLHGFAVRPGKVSDSIYGGRMEYYDKSGKTLLFENPPLNMKDGTPLRIMVRTDRISTHDINRGEVPFKDQILATNHHVMRRLVKDALGTSQFDVPGLEDTSVVIAAENLQTLPIEMVLRAYMAKSTTATSLYQAWLRGETTFCGHPVSRDWIPNGKLPYVMDTPSTKSEEHDESVPPSFFFERDICTPFQYARMRNAALVAFGVVSEFVRNKGLILVDTKTEHGITRNGRIVSQDELYTLDSSRFWLMSDYAQQLERLARGEIKELDPVSYSKEFARGFSRGDQGYTPEQRREIAVRYIMGIQHLTGEPFTPDLRSREERVISGLEMVVRELVAEPCARVL